MSIKCKLCGLEYECLILWDYDVYGSESNLVPKIRKFTKVDATKEYYCD